MSQSGLLKAAMLGTQRADAKPLGEAPDPVLQTVWQALAEKDDPAQALLQAAALEHIGYQAGVKALQADIPPACEPETKSYVSPAAAAAFVDLIQASHTRLTREWIEVARSHELLATPRLLPSLLAIGESNVGLRAAVSDLVGNRGQWFANREGKWSWLHTAPDSQLTEGQSTQLWNTGTPLQRRNWLQQHLQLDPELAANSVSASWSGESPDTREMFVALVANNPDPAHEEWLQNHALTDRRQATRTHAIRALMAIDSGFRQRALSRAAAVLSVPKKLLAKKVIHCEAPKTFDPQWLLDGIREKPPSGTGPRDYWLLQILRVIPLKDWKSLTGHDDPLNLKIESDWSGTVLKAWQQSALSQPDAQSVLPLLARLGKSGGKSDADHLSAMIAIVAAIDQNHVAEVLEQLKISDVHSRDLLLKTLPSLSIDSHPRLHKIATDWVFTKVQMNKPEAVSLAGCCDHRAVAALLEKISKAKTLTSAAEEFTRTLEYRQSYLKHFDDHAATAK